MPSYVKDALGKDERVIYKAGLHWIIYVQGLMFVAAGGLFAFFAPRIMINVFDAQAAAEAMTKPFGVIGGILLIAGLSLMLGAYIRQSSTELVVTNMRIIAKYGFVSRATYEIMINRVTGANFDQTIGGRIFGYGTVMVHGAGADMAPVDLIADPQRFHNELMSTVETRR